jgi:asparagine synthase (glutamine-hydrolysing)
MCGFVGIINKDGLAVEGTILKRMADAIHHRGPDEDGILLEKNIGFFHKRLSIIDLNTGSQPMHSGGCTIIYNGEIYNYIELRNSLIALGHQFTTTSDTEVILRLYIQYGKSCVEMLNGMFAFVIYNRNQQQLFVARDHFGIKPLYWYHDDRQILFGSEIKALLKHPSIVTGVEQANLNEYLTFQFVMGEGTMFKNIRKIQAGHYIVINLQSFDYEQIKYWEPNFKIDKYHTEEYFVHELRSILHQTISQQLRSDVPVGTYLSGGLDSSFVTIMAGKMLGKPIKSFSGAFNEGPEFNELLYAREAANAAGAELYEVFPTEQQFIDTLPGLIYSLDEPVAGPGLFPQYIVSKAASEQVKVILGGQGGDEIFGGYARYLVAYLEQAIKGAIFESNEEGEHIVSLRSILPNLPSLRQYIPMMRGFWNDGAFDQMDRRYFNLLNRLGSVKQFINPDFIESMDQEVIFSKFSGYFNNSETKSYFNKMTHFDMFGSLPGLLQVEDRVSMSVSIESRVPLLDRRIVDLISVMPAGMKYKGAEMKYLLKKAIGDTVPDLILKRKDKMGFPVPLHIWTRNKAKPFMMDVLLSKKSKERGILNTKTIEKLITSEEPFSRGLWGLLSLELWYNQFMDN